MTEARYHITARGKPAPCHAKQRPCPLGLTAEEHYPSEEAAYEALAQEHETLVAMKKQVLETELKEQKPKTVRYIKNHEVKLRKAVLVPHDPQARYGVLSDVDGTLTKGSLVLDHAIYLHHKGVIDLGSLPEQWLAEPKNEKLIVTLAEAYREALVGKKVADLQVEEFLREYDAIPGKMYSTMAQLITLRKRGWEVQLISGSPSFLVKPFAEHHGFFGTGSDYKADEEGYLTGEVEGMFGHEAKRGYIKKLSVERFKRVLAFGDTASDAPLFESADHATLVDPTQETLSRVQAKVIVRE